MCHQTNGHRITVNSGTFRLGNSATNTDFTGNTRADEVERMAAAAQAAVRQEQDQKARKGLEDLYRQLASAQNVVRGIEAQIVDRKASLIDGSYC